MHGHTHGCTLTLHLPSTAHFAPCPAWTSLVSRGELLGTPAALGQRSPPVPHYEDTCTGFERCMLALHVLCCMSFAVCTTKVPARGFECCMLFAVCTAKVPARECLFELRCHPLNISANPRSGAAHIVSARLCTRTHTHTSLPRAGKPGRTCEWTRPQPRRPLLRAYEPIEYSEIPSARTSCALLGAQAKYGAPHRQRARPVALSVSRGAAPSASRASARAGRRGKARRLLIGFGRSLSVRSSSAECTPRSTRR